MRTKKTYSTPGIRCVPLDSSEIMAGSVTQGTGDTPGVHDTEFDAKDGGLQDDDAAPSWK